MTGSPATRTPPAAAAVHEHGWLVESAHRTSEGIVQYVRCADCGVRRVDVAAVPAVVPGAVSRELG